MSASEMQLATTQGVADAPLPVRYEAAKRELAECERVDECASWAKKASALSSYARQAGDKSLEEMAVRIRARAIRRCGELLKEIPAKAHGREVDGHPPTSQRSERSQAAKAAGLSSAQTKDALRIAKIPEGEFEKAIESEDPPTVTELAERGTARKPLVDIMGRDPEAYNRSLLLNGAMNDLAAMLRNTTTSAHFGGCVPRHYQKMRESATAICEWLTELLTKMEKAK